jgi:hypothetical protein
MFFYEANGVRPKVKFFCMLDLKQYSSLGAALTAALDRWPNETCLIEADRDREKLRLTY